MKVIFEEIGKPSFLETDDFDTDTIRKKLLNDIPEKGGTKASIPSTHIFHQ
jgi:hypothetical protein